MVRRKAHSLESLPGVTIHSATTLESLADQAIDLLATPMGAPLSPEWIAVPSVGIRRWLSARMSQVLGGEAENDGISINIRWAFPDSLRAAVLGHSENQHDAYSIESMSWAIAQLLSERVSDPVLDIVTTIPPGGTLVGRARQIADLYDRYLRRRPSMVHSWKEGNDTNARGEPLPSRSRWQPVLWRLLVDAIDEPNPSEELATLLDDLASRRRSLELPHRLIFFGSQVLPAGPEFLELLKAVGVQHEIHLFLLTPSPALAERASSLRRENSPVAPRDPLLMEQVANSPLLRAWGRSIAETAWILGDLLPIHDAPTSNETALGHLQEALYNDVNEVRPSVDPKSDRSIEIVGCVGPVRQVEVLRDRILHLLSEDKDLRESDIVIICPDLVSYAPLLSSIFGPSAPPGIYVPTDSLIPSIRYRLADRSLAETIPIIKSLVHLLSISTGRLEASTICDLLLDPFVSTALELDGDSASRAIQLIRDADVRWGLDVTHRERFDLPPTITSGTWRDGLDRLLLGAVIGSPSVAPKDLLPPIAIESSEIDTVGAAVALLDRLRLLQILTEDRRTPQQWLDEVVIPLRHGLLASPPDEEWQDERTDEWLSVLQSDVARVTLEISFEDLKEWIADAAEIATPRSANIDGSVTVASFLPVRSVPYKVIFVLGLDDDALPSMPQNVDDLVGLSPLVGDPDARDDLRSSLLSMVQGARDRLVILHSSQNATTSETIPVPGVIDDLLDALAALGFQRDDFCVTHPRHSFSEAEFVSDYPGIEHPFSFDDGSAGGAKAKRTATYSEASWAETVTLSVPLLEQVSLDELQRFLQDPPSTFLTSRLDMWISSFEEVFEDELAIELNSMTRAQLATELVEALLENPDESPDVVATIWRFANKLDPRLPSGILGDAALTNLLDRSYPVAQKAQIAGLFGKIERIPVTFTLPSGRCVSGEVPLYEEHDAIGFARPSSTAANRFFTPWIQLLALAIAYPDRSPRGAAISYDTMKKGPRSIRFTLDERRDTLPRVFDQLVDLYVLAQASPLPFSPRAVLDVLDDNQIDSGRMIENLQGYLAHSRSRAVPGCLPEKLTELRSLSAREPEQRLLGVDDPVRPVVLVRGVADLVRSSCSVGEV